MLGKNLKNWVAQSESWAAFKEFNLSIENVADYIFLKRFDDFYISLFTQLFDELDNTNSIDNKKQLLAIGKGLEVFSLRNTSKEFIGVNESRNMLYVGSLYYLADYSASSYILARMFDVQDYSSSEIEEFISCFLRRNLKKSNSFASYLWRFLHDGDTKEIIALNKLLEEKLEKSAQSFSAGYTSYRIGLAIIEKFSKNNIWTDLITHSSINRQEWYQYVQTKLGSKPPLWDFFPSQKEAFKRGLLKENKTFSLQMPTSSGKTAICEIVIYNEVMQNKNKKILFLAPFRALAAELKAGLGKRLADLSISSKTIYGGNISSEDERIAIENVDVLIATPEKLMALEHQMSDMTNMFSLIICDEGHLLDDEQRGLSYELLLSKFKGSNQDVRFLYMSAIIPNIEHINLWLGGDEESVIKSDYRPTQLNFAFLKSMSKDNKTFYLDVNPTQKHPENYLLYKFLTKNEFEYIKKTTGKKNTYKYSSIKSKSVAVSLKSINSGTVALFCPTKGKDSFGQSTGIYALANEVIEQLNHLNFSRPLDMAKKDTIDMLYDYFSIIFGTDYLLTKLVTYGVLFHHGDLPQYVREVIEDSIRYNQIRLIICTSTLAEGVNLPIKTIVIHSVRRYIPELEQHVELLPREIRNVVGRAGRAGQETKGLVIVINPTDFSIMENVLNNQENEEDQVQGYLQFLIRSLESFLKKKQIPIDNEFLESRSEKVNQIIDSIDMSIISLLAEEVEMETLENEIKSLISKTFSFYQSNESQKEILNKLFQARGERIKPYIKSGEFKLIKSSGANLRLYEEIHKTINFEDDLWLTATSPASCDTVKFLLEPIFKLPQIQFAIEEFNKKNKPPITTAVLKKIIEFWISGKWYNEISLQTNLPVDYILRVFSSIINYHIQNTISHVVRIVESACTDSEKTLSEVVKLWPSFLLYGLYNKLQLDLVELGFTDRIGIIAISEWFDSELMQYQTLDELRMLVLSNQNKLNIKLDTLPEISKKKVYDNIQYLSNSFIF
jgi:superfamily II DNA/RNA helicase